MCREQPRKRLYTSQLFTHRFRRTRHEKIGQLHTALHPLLKANTVKNWYHLPLIRETQDRLSKAQCYTKLDLRQGYHQIRMAMGEEWKTAIRTRYDNLEYTVMPFGLTNATATFQHFVNDRLKENRNIFCILYLDDLLIYSDNLPEHKQHVRKVLQTIQNNGVLHKPEKCEYHTKTTTSISLIISPSGVDMDPRNVKAVQDWNTSKNVNNVQAFLAFANFYQGFIRRLPKVANPLTQLTWEDLAIQWAPEAQQAFETLKKDFTTAHILAYFDLAKEILDETDASDYISGGILSQYND